MSNLRDRAHAALMLSEASKNLYHINEQKEASRLAREAGSLFSSDIGQASAPIGDAQTANAGDSGQAVPPEGKCGCGALDCVDNEGSDGKSLYEAIFAEQLGVDTGDLHINDKGQVYIHGRLVGYAILRR